MNRMFNLSNATRTVIPLKNADGTSAGTISITKPKKKKTKRLRYDFKEISSQIMGAKTSSIARGVAIRARGKVVMLMQKVRSSEYDSKELEAALIHAQKMERIAKKRMKHLEQEEKISARQDRDKEQEILENSGIEDFEQMLEKRQELLEELEAKLMEKSMEELPDAMEDAADLEELSEEFSGAAKIDMDPKDLESLKKKHRAEELREIMEADMKYLKALFEQLEKEKQEGPGAGVSLQLEGMEVPLQEMEAPVMTEGGNVDISL